MINWRVYWIMNWMMSGAVPDLTLLHTKNMSAQLTSTIPNKVLYTYVKSAFKRLSWRLSKFSFANLPL